MTAAAAIEVAALQKSFRALPVLRGVDLRVARGELVGLVGRNGAGKSTLLRVLIGLVARDGGAVAVLGLDPARADLAIRANCSYLPGETSIYTQMTGQQFLDFALCFYPRHQQRLLALLLDLFALPLQQKVRSYSAGMKQKLAILATLVPDVDLYLLDEPDRALDASMRLQLRAALLAMKRAGKTIVLSSHHLSEVERLADRLEFLVDGAFVPQPRIETARATLRRRVRLHLATPAPLPAGWRELAREGDGTLVVEGPGEAAQLLAALPAGSVRAAEVGIARLEDLYALLVHADGDAAPEAAP